MLVPIRINSDIDKMSIFYINIPNESMSYFLPNKLGLLDKKRSQ